MDGKRRYEAARVAGHLLGGVPHGATKAQPAVLPREATVLSLAEGFIAIVAITRCEPDPSKHALAQATGDPQVARDFRLVMILSVKGRQVG